MRPGFRPDIQGLRAIAVLAVVLNHANVPGLGGGFVGVDVFFVISGFLITSQLERTWRADGRIRLGEFYARRARRILPASFTVLALSIAGAFVLIPPLLREQTLKDALATALYVPNLYFAQQGTDYLAESSPSLFQHYWSLGVEEQFYLVWPLVLIGLLTLLGSARTARSRRMLILAVGVLVAVSLAASVWETFHSQPWAFFAVWSRAWQLGAGALVALLAAAARRWMPDPVAAPLAWLGLGGILVSAVVYSADTVYPGVAALLPTLGTALVIAGGVSAPRFGPAALLVLRPFAFIGEISYSLYLVHWPVLILADVAVGEDYTIALWQRVALMVGAVVLAWTLHRFVEDPARRAPRLAGARPRHSLVLAGGASATLAAAAVLSLLVTQAVPLNAGVRTAVSAPSDPPVAASIVPANLRPSLQAAADDNPTIYDDGCELGYTATTPKACTFGDAGDPRVVLFGDSHAAQWFPALQSIAGEHGLRLETHTKSACSSPDVELLHDGSPYVACDAWRDAVIDQLRADPPAMVVLASYTAPAFADSTDAGRQWRDGLERTIQRLSDVTKVVVVADTPDFRDSPLVCLSAHLESATDCARSRSFALDSPGRSGERAAARATGTRFVDLTGYFCGTRRCPAIIGSTLAYRDSHHITATFSRELAPVLAPSLLTALPVAPASS